MKKYLLCIGTFALIAIVACLAAPPGAYASDAWGDVSAGDRYDGSITAVLVTPIEINDLAIMPAAITSGLRTGLTARKHEHNPSCTPAMAANPSAMIGGALLRFSKSGV